MATLPNENKNSKVLRDFTRFCEDNPELRFWQALKEWSGHAFILSAEGMDGNNGDYLDIKDTYYRTMVTN